MSRKSKPRVHGQRARFAWPILGVGVILVAAAVFLLTRPGDDGGTPQIVVDTQKIDLGYVKFGEMRSFEIAVTNAGDGVLRFKQKPYIEILEGC